MLVSPGRGQIFALRNDGVVTDDEQGDAIDEDESNDPDDKEDSK